MRSNKILVVEDERIVARDIELTLKKAGYSVVGTAATGPTAIELAEAHGPDLVLMDVMLAGPMNGIEAARAIRKRREIPVVYLTANGDPGVVEDAKSTEPIGFIRKPYEEENLLTTIEVALHQYVAQRERSTQALRQSEARYEELFETAREGMATTDRDGRHLECNRAYVELFGYDCAEPLRRMCFDGLTAPEFREHEQRLVREQALIRGYSDEYEKECVRSDGSRLVVSCQVLLRCDIYGVPEGLWVMARDISERRENERRILAYQEELRSLVREMATLEERERQRVANDIHDRISQTLAVCQMRLQAVSQALEGKELARECDQISELLERSLRDTSSLMFELSPPVLHQLGLKAALEWFAEQVQSRHGLKFEVRELGVLPLSSDERSLLFRAACELMVNAGKHAQAVNGVVELRAADGKQAVLVEDDGVGFTPETGLAARRSRGGFGLFQVRERLWGWGGRLEIDSKPGRGTRALIELTVKRSQSKSTP